MTAVQQAFHRALTQAPSTPLTARVRRALSQTTRPAPKTPQNAPAAQPPAS